MGMKISLLSNRPASRLFDESESEKSLGRGRVGPPSSVSSLLRCKLSTRSMYAWTRDAHACRSRSKVRASRTLSFLRGVLHLASSRSMVNVLVIVSGPNCGSGGDRDCRSHVSCRSKVRATSCSRGDVLTRVTTVWELVPLLSRIWLLFPPSSAVKLYEN
jgi:hypothetical protein